MAAETISGTGEPTRTSVRGLSRPKFSRLDQVGEPDLARVDELTEVGAGNGRGHHRIRHRQGEVLHDVEQDEFRAELIGQFGREPHGRGGAIAEIRRDEDSFDGEHVVPPG